MGLEREDGACAVSIWKVTNSKPSKHVAVLLVLQFLIGTATTGIFNICGTLLVDLHPDCPSAVSALLNLIRCSLSATGLAVLQIIINHFGIGWCFTIFSVIAATTIPLLLAETK